MMFPFEVGDLICSRQIFWLSYREKPHTLDKMFVIDKGTIALVVGVNHEWGFQSIAVNGKYLWDVQIRGVQPTWQNGWVRL